jgi:hypothetical protein
MKIAWQKAVLWIYIVSARQDGWRVQLGYHLIILKNMLNLDYKESNIKALNTNKQNNVSEKTLYCLEIDFNLNESGLVVDYT